ncbi:NRDE family protein [Jeotgalibaca sp. MA1X17-3]|uniref:NRDE family protein n=1 Tax=Jeotgalibaca sp. MA1X17-3 TaxID=2908211 RepID=UPI001F176B99|nr:NRDE family protein [Jeotgalibaca sp. MA1X17-3]UJF15787.1 NRDE family protein [Jeotgalibaca sp. MA1X17-3]
MMCLITFHLSSHPTYKLILAANRDELYERPTAPANFWKEFPDLLAGKDLQAKGTWLGITKTGKIAAITNCYDAETLNSTTQKNSRGKIIIDYLTSKKTATQYLEQLITKKNQYLPFNVLLGDINKFYHFNSQNQSYTLLPKGTHSLSNATINTPWLKVTNTKEKLNMIIDTSNHYADQLFQMMMNQTPAPDQQLPDISLPIAIKRKVSANFIDTENFGTRSTTLILVDHNNMVTFIERTYDSKNNSQDHSYHFQVSER